MKRSLLLLFLLGTVMRIIWVLLFPAQPISANVADGIYYLETAKSLATVGRYEFHGKPTAYFPPGYPLYLALVFKLTRSSTFEVAQWANLFLSVLVPLLALWIGRSLGSPRIGHYSAVVLLFSPIQLVWTGIVMSELFFTVLICGAIAVFISWLQRAKGAKLIAAGIMAGLATLTRGQGIVVVVSFVVVLFLQGWKNRGWRQVLLSCLVVCCSFLITLAPWVIRNVFVTGSPRLSTNTAINFFIGNHPGATGGYSLPPDFNPDEFEN